MASAFLSGNTRRTRPITNPAGAAISCIVLRISNRSRGDVEIPVRRDPSVLTWCSRENAILSDQETWPGHGEWPAHAWAETLQEQEQWRRKDPTVDTCSG